MHQVVSGHLAAVLFQYLLPQGHTGERMGMSSGRVGGRGSCHRSSRKAPK